MSEWRALRRICWPGYADAVGRVQAQDVLVAVDGVPVLDTTSIAELQAAVSAAGRPLVLTFRTPLLRGTDPDALSLHAERLRRECRFLSAAAGYSMALAAGHTAPGWCLNQHGTCLGMAGTRQNLHLDLCTLLRLHNIRPLRLYTICRAATVLLV